MIKRILVIIALSGMLVVVLPGVLFGHTRRVRRRSSRMHPDKPIRKLRHQVGQKFRRPQPVQKKPPSLKKKIIVFSSLGGGGHLSVSKGLCGYLGDKYDVEIVNVLKTILAPIDTLGTLTFGKVTGEDMYNFFLRCGWTNVIRNYSYIGHSIMHHRHGVMIKLMRRFLLKEKPSLVISVIPHVNKCCLAVCQELDIPFLIITNDLDSTNYMNGLSPPYYKKFKYAIPFEYKPIRDKIESAHIPKEQIVVTGFPLRPEFFKKKKVSRIKKEFKIPAGKPVVMVFMGGAGSQASYRYVRKLAKLNIPMHIIVCLGRNERLKRNIRKIPLPEGVTITLMGYTNRIADLMAISDVLITKPGPNSVCEGLQSQVPMVLDQTSGTIFWEQLNIDFMVDNGFAESLKDYVNLEGILPKYFVDSSFTNGVKKKMRDFKGERYDKVIGPLVDQMVALAGPASSLSS